MLFLLLNKTTTADGIELKAARTIDSSFEDVAAIAAAGGVLLPLPNTAVFTRALQVRDQQGRGRRLAELDILTAAFAEFALGGGGSLVFEDEGASLGPFANANFKGAGVTLTPNGSTVDIDIPGGGGSSVPATRQVIAGAGLTGGGDLSADRTFDVGANADGSIIVNANDVQVGTINDGQHGGRGGGTLHALAVPLGNAGFMSGADKSKLDGVTAGATNTPLGGATPTAVLPDDAGNAGSSSSAARQDHQHPIVADVAVDVGVSNAEGTAASFSRSDHLHRLTFAVVQALLGAATGPVSFNGQEGTNFATPSAASSAATKGYVDTVAQGLDVKANVRLIALSNVVLSGVQTVDGVATSTGNRVLAAGQTVATQNGIYVTAAGAWARSADLPAGASAEGAFAFVAEGAVESDTGWICTNNAPNDVVGTNALAFAQFSTFQLATVAPLDVDRSAAAVGASSRAAREDHKHDVSVAAPGSILVGDAAAPGAASTLVRSDHVHGLPAPGVPANVDRSAASAGASTKVAREDHKHDVAVAAPGTINVGDAAAQGSASTMALSDHQHALLAPAAPVDVDRSAAGAGASSRVARQDHKHDVSVGTPATIGAANAAGAAASLVRSDHVHDHGSQTVGTMHAVAVPSGANGFMSGADKAKLDALAPGSVEEVRFATALVNASSATSIPANARVLFSSFEVTTPYSPGTTATLGRTGSTALVMPAADNLATAAGMYAEDQDTAWGGSALPVLFTVAGSPATGAGVVVVRYTTPDP